MTDTAQLDVIYITYPVDLSEYPILADSVRLFVDAFQKTYSAPEHNTDDVVIDLLTDSQHIMFMVTVGGVEFEWIPDKERILRRNMADAASADKSIRDIVNQNIFFYKNNHPSYFGKNGFYALYRVKLPDTSEIESILRSRVIGQPTPYNSVDKTAMVEYVKTLSDGIVRSINVSGLFGANSKEPRFNVESLSDALSKYATENIVLISVDLSGNFMVNVLCRAQSNVSTDMIWGAISICNVRENKLIWEDCVPYHTYHRFLAAMFMGSTVSSKRYPSEYCRILDPRDQLFADNVIATMSPVNPAFVYIKEKAN